MLCVLLFFFAFFFFKPQQFCTLLCIFVVDALDLKNFDNLCVCVVSYMCFGLILVILLKYGLM